MVEGFAAAEKLHGVRYTTFIGDGDSSVYPALTQRIPVWGHAIRKLECTNHARKCYRDHWRSWYMIIPRTKEVEA